MAKARYAALLDAQELDSRASTGAAPVPVAVGFGIRTPEQAKAIDAGADGVVVMRGKRHQRQAQLVDQPAGNERGRGHLGMGVPDLFAGQPPAVLEHGQNNGQSDGRLGRGEARCGPHLPGAPGGRA